MGAFRIDRAAAWLYGATMVANVLSFGYQFVMARLLAPPEYAILTALFGYLILEGIGTQVIQSAAAKLAAAYRARGEEAALHAFSRRWLRRIALISGPPALAIVVLAAPLGGALALPPFTIALLGLALFAIGLLTLTQGLLQGLRRFGWLGSVLPSRRRVSASRSRSRGPACWRVRRRVPRRVAVVNIVARYSAGVVSQISHLERGSSSSRRSLFGGVTEPDASPARSSPAEAAYPGPSRSAGRPSRHRGALSSCCTA